MFKKIYKEIKKYQHIVIARHVGVDPDALASQLALKAAIELTFPDKYVLAVGNGSVKFSYLGKLDKWEHLDQFLLIVLDTPDKKRIDFADMDKASCIIKMDHHPFIEAYAGLEYIDEHATSTCEILMDFLEKMKFVIDTSVAMLLYSGLVSDSNRFLFDSCSPKTFALVSRYLQNYPFVLSEVYKPLYLRPLKEVRLEGYIAQNMKASDHGVAFIYLSNDIINQFGTDSAAAGNMINHFNFIDEILVWVVASDDLKNHNIRVNIRSRGPIVNKIAEKYYGGGHAMASGARVGSIEEVEALCAELEEITQDYIRRLETNEDQ